MPTGVIAAAALKCMGGHLQGRLHPRNDEERKRAVEAGYDLDAILHTNDLAKGDQVGVSSCHHASVRLLPCLLQHMVHSCSYMHDGCSADSATLWRCSADLLCSDGCLRWRPASWGAIFCWGCHHQQHGDAAPVRHR